MIDIEELRKVIADCYWPTSPIVINKLLDRLEEAERQTITLTDALRSTAQTLAWMQHGKCRGFSDDLLTTNEALEKARAALKESK